MRVYKYGLLPPTLNAEMVGDQIQLAHRYRNQLIELERTRRGKIRKWVDQDSDVRVALIAAEEAKEKEKTLYQILSEVNAKNRSKSKTDPNLKKEYAEAKKVYKKKFDTLKKARSKALKANKEKIDEVNSWHNEERKKKRANSNVFWGTYTIVEDAMNRSAKQPLWDWIEPNDPRSVRFTGEGRVSVQLQKDSDGKVGMAEAHVFGGNDSRLQIDPVDENAWYSPSRSVRRKKSRTALRIRVGSEKGRDPIWAEWPMIMHRPLPEGSRIKRVTVNRRHIGPRTEWTADFFVDDSKTSPTRSSAPVATGSVGLDVGWRQMDDGSLRALCWYEGEKGRTGEFRLSPSLISALRKSDELRSIRDQNLNAALIAVVAHFHKTLMPKWVREVTGKKEDRVPTNAQACAYLAKWKSSARLAALTKRWKTEGVTAKHQEAYNALENWRYHDFHLWQWESSQRRKAERRRKDEYRNFAATLSKQYHTLVIEDFNLTKIIKRKESDDDSPDNQKSRGNRKLVCLSELRDVLKNAFEKCGEVKFVDAKNTTRICSFCGTLNTFDAAANLEHTCTGCGELWDQDENASKVIYYRGERSNGEKRSGGDTCKRTNRKKTKE